MTRRFRWAWGSLMVVAVAGILALMFGWPPDPPKEPAASPSFSAPALRTTEATSPDDTQQVNPPLHPARPGAGDSGSVGAGEASMPGQATWYRWRAGQAAAGPALRAWLGPGWRGESVRVCTSLRCVIVRLTDWCACHPATRLVDLDAASFAVLAPLSRGVLAVTAWSMH